MRYDCGGYHSKILAVFRPGMRLRMKVVVLPVIKDLVLHKEDRQQINISKTNSASRNNLSGFREVGRMKRIVLSREADVGERARVHAAPCPISG